MARRGGGRAAGTRGTGHRRLRPARSVRRVLCVAPGDPPAEPRTGQGGPGAVGRGGALRDDRPRDGARRRDAGRVREARLQNRRGPLSGGDPGGARRPGARAGRRGTAAGSAAAVRTPAAWCRRRRRRLRAGHQTTPIGCCPGSTCGAWRPSANPSTAGSCTRWRRAASTGSGTAWWSRSCKAGSCGTMTCCVWPTSR